MHIDPAKLRYLLSTYKLTQKELAASAGIAQSSVSSALHGNAEVKDDTAHKIAAALRIPVSDLTNAEGMLDVTECPRCASKDVSIWHSLADGSYRYRCNYCEADTGPQKSKAQAIHIFLCFKKAERSDDSLHVMTLSELLDSSAYDSDDIRPVWFENRGLFVVPALLQNGIAEREHDIVRVEWHGSYGAKSFYTEQYCSWWRVWSDKPSQAQCDAEAWKN